MPNPIPELNAALRQAIQQDKAEKEIRLLVDEISRVVAKLDDYYSQPYLEPENAGDYAREALLNIIAKHDKRWGNE